MTPDDLHREADDPRRLAAPITRPPRPRTDPAAMRETLDAARRRLGPADPTTDPVRSAKRLRALLREAAAGQSTTLRALPDSGAGRDVAAHDAGDGLRH